MSITFEEKNNMNKECEYCGTEFTARRSDAKYCSKTCKNEAYLARKDGIGVISGHNMNHQSDINMNPTVTNNRRTSLQDQIKQLIAQSNDQPNQMILNHLLSEKDNSGDYRSENSQLQMKLMFIERDLQMAEKKVTELETENTKLLEKVEGFEDSGINKVIGFCEKNPAVVMPIISKLTGANIQNPKIGLNESQFSKEDLEMGERISIAMGTMGEVYDDPVKVLEDLSTWVKANPVMAQTMLSQIQKEDKTIN